MVMPTKSRLLGGYAKSLWWRIASKTMHQIVLQWPSVTDRAVSDPFEFFDKHSLNRGLVSLKNITYD
jgi:hypothetical protein